MTCIPPLEHFWSDQIASIYEVAEAPPGCFASVSTPQNEWQRWNVTELTADDAAQASRDAHAKAWWEQCKGMGIIVGSFFLGVGSVIGMLVVANLIVHLTLTLFASFFAVPVIGPITAFVVVGFEAINIALTWIVLMGQLYSKVLIPTVASCLNYQLHLEGQALQLDGRAAAAN